jgi:predicted MFS family arabinose efflux permease
MRDGSAYRQFPTMRRRRLKTGYFALEALNSFAATFFLFYLFFLTRDEFQFTSRGNLFLTALHGGVYILASWQGGRFAQRFGYITALRLGYVGMMAALVLGWLMPGITGQILALALWTAPLCLIWPTLEALVTEGEDFNGTARMVGIYNVVWSASAAAAYCTGGWFWDRFGRAGLYWIPFGLFAAQFALTWWLQRTAMQAPMPDRPAAKPVHEPEATARQQQIPPRRFLQMAWLANPFSYVAINTVCAVIPQLAERFQLTPTQSGVFCSVWFYVRMAAFLALWRWTGWHYRFRWLLTAFVGLVVSFAALVLAPQLWVVIAAQVVFGLVTGLIYYSSLFYSMDVGETKGEHGGLHEAAIGAGICGGPLLGALALSLAPATPNAGAYAVTALLTLGLGGLLRLRRRPGP